jgi:hypothetical protein
MESVNGGGAGSVAETAPVETEPAETAPPESVGADTGPTASATASETQAEGSNADEPTGFADSGFESASENLDDPVEAQLAALTETVERQNELLQRQQQTIERLIEELSRGR